MQLHTLILPDGSQIRSGSEEAWAIVSVRIQQSVNRGSTLRPGSVCTASAQVELFAPAEGAILPGAELMLYQGGQPVGIFTVTQALRPSRGRLKLTLADRGIRLQKELTHWLEDLTGWPCTLWQLAQLAAGECGLEFENDTIPNASTKIDKFRQGIVTGAELLGWCAELAGCYCHVTAAGKLRFGRYTPSGIRLSPTGERFYYRDSLAVSAAPVEEVAGIALRDPESGSFLPSFAPGANVYRIEGNPLTAHVGQEQLDQMLAGFPKGWSFGTVTVPDSVPVQVGQTVEIFDGFRTVTLPVMERTVENGRQTLSALGVSGRAGSISAQARALAQQLILARQAVDAQTQADIFNKLTDNGRAQGVFLQDGQLYINASFLAAGILDASLIRVVNLIAEKLCSVLEDSSLEIDGAQLQMKSGELPTVQLSNESAGLPILYMTDYQGDQIQNRLELSPHHLRLGGSGTAGGFYLDAGGGRVLLDIEQGNPRTLSWSYDSGLGKYVLTGM